MTGPRKHRHTWRLFPLKRGVFRDAWCTHCGIHRSEDPEVPKTVDDVYRRMTPAQKEAVQFLVWAAHDRAKSAGGTWIDGKTP